ncbi:MAG: hypothetical protein AMJ84_00490 [Acidithiobacillales bacterium SM23_46]|nr:MAG: hypothetical protein AMJ84_00490 [Acidithiobacillales bacterium SM23_46]
MHADEIDGERHAGDRIERDIPQTAHGKLHECRRRGPDDPEKHSRHGEPVDDRCAPEEQWARGDQR